MKRGEKLHFFMEEKGYNKSTLSKEADVPYTTLDSMLKNNLKNSSIDNVIKICRVLGIKVEDLMEDRHSLVSEGRVEYNSETDEYSYFPISISAGLPINVEPIVEGEKISIPKELLGKYARNKDIYFMKVNGESMNKVIPHGSIIAVKQIEINELKNGDIVVYSDCYDYSVKRFFDIGDKIVFKPESTDPMFYDTVFDKVNEDLRIHGKVVTYIVNLN